MFCGGGTGIVGFFLAQPQVFYCSGMAWVALSQQGIAAHLTVVAHAEFGVFGHKDGPIAAAAQHQQPVVAQPVFLVGTGVAVQKDLNFVGRSHV